MTDQSSATADNAELIARLQHRGVGKENRDRECLLAAKALIKADERIAELERERDGWRTDALLAESRVAECNQRAEAAELKVGDLERALECEQRALAAEADAHLKSLARAKAAEDAVKERRNAWKTDDLMIQLAGIRHLLGQLQPQSAAVIADAETRIMVAEARVKALEEALTPSEFTKVAYQGRFEFSVSDRPYIVPWVTIKQIMAHILGRAALAQSGER